MEGKNWSGQVVVDSVLVVVIADQKKFQAFLL